MTTEITYMHPTLHVRARFLQIPQSLLAVLPCIGLFARCSTVQLIFLVGIHHFAYYRVTYSRASYPLVIVLTEQTTRVVVPFDEFDQ